MSRYRAAAAAREQRRARGAAKLNTFATIERIDGEKGERWEAILWSPGVAKVASGRGGSKVAALLAAMDANGERARR